MKTQSSVVPASTQRGAMVVRLPSEDQLWWFDGVLADHHYLGAGRAVGDYLRPHLNPAGAFPVSDEPIELFHFPALDVFDCRLVRCEYADNRRLLLFQRVANVKDVHVGSSAFGGTVNVEDRWLSDESAA